MKKLEWESEQYKGLVSYGKNGKKFSLRQVYKSQWSLYWEFYQVDIDGDEHFVSSFETLADAEQVAELINEIGI